MHDDKNDKKPSPKKDPVPPEGFLIHSLPEKTLFYYERIYKMSDRIYKIFSWIIYASLFYFVYRETKGSFLGDVSWVCYFILVTIVSLNISSFFLYMGSKILVRLEGGHYKPNRRSSRIFGYGVLMLLSLAAVDSFLLAVIRHFIHHVQDIIHMRSGVSGSDRAITTLPPP